MYRTCNSLNGRWFKATVITPIPGTGENDAPNGVMKGCLKPKMPPVSVA